MAPQSLYSVFEITLKIIQITGCFHLKNIQYQNTKISSSIALLHSIHIIGSFIACIDSKTYVLATYNSVSIFRFLNFMVFIVLASPTIFITDLFLLPKLKLVFDILTEIDQKYFASKSLYQVQRISIPLISLLNTFVHLVTYYLQLLLNPFGYEVRLIFGIIFRSLLSCWMLTLVVLEMFILYYITIKNRDFLEMVIKAQGVSLGKLRIKEMTAKICLVVTSVFEYFALNNLMYVTMAFNSTVISIRMVFAPEFSSVLMGHYFFFYPYLVVICILGDFSSDMVSRHSINCNDFCSGERD